jgi:hypothetical protein
MHDCFGKPLKPFDRVRAATKEELEAQGHPEASYPLILSPAEQIALPGTYGSETCNVYVAPQITFAPTPTVAGGIVEMKLQVGTVWPTICTARTLVKVEA